MLVVPTSRIVGIGGPIDASTIVGRQKDFWNLESADLWVDQRFWQHLGIRDTKMEEIDTVLIIVGSHQRA